MTNKLLFAGLLFTISAFKNADSQADTITGKWMSTENNLEVEVFKSGNAYQARVVWFDDTDNPGRPMAVRQDTKNPDKTLRSRKIIGLPVMYGLMYNAEDKEWEDGRIYDPSTGKNWNANAWIDSGGLLRVRGYWHFSIFGQTMRFKKV
jgi:uncharacterized protein (DUF2147 family)